MEQMDLFKVLGLTPVEETSATKKSTTKSNETKKAKAHQPKKKKGSTVKLPAKIFTGYFDPIELTAEQLGADEVTSSVLSEKVCENFGYPKDLFTLEIEDSNVYVSILPACEICKGNIHLTRESVMRLGQYQYDMSSVMSDDECDVDLDELKKFVATATPVLGSEKKITFWVKDNYIIPKSNLAVTCPSTLEFPIRVDILGRESLTISEEMYRSAIPNGVDSCEETDEMNEDKSKIDRDILVRIVEEHYADFKGHCDMRFARDHAVVQMCRCTSTTSNVKKLIPVEGTTISLLFTKIPLSADMFDGDEEVEEDEIIKYLASIYPEYSKERTEIIYDAKKHLIIPILKGSRKGAGVEVVTDEHRALELLSHEVCLYDQVVDGEVYRVEKLPFLQVCISKSRVAGTYQWCLPKIPAEIFAQARAFFREVSIRYDTEAMLQLFWDSDEKSFFLYCPKQKVTHASLCIERNWELERESWLVMDLHSHGRINCSFSATDDQDELGTRFYGVFYGYGIGNEPRFDVRVGCGGFFLPVEKNRLFKQNDVASEQYDFNDWLSQIEKC